MTCNGAVDTYQMNNEPLYINLTFTPPGKWFFIIILLGMGKKVLLKYCISYYCQFGTQNKALISIVAMVLINTLVRFVSQYYFQTAVWCCMHAMLVYTA